MSQDCCIAILRNNNKFTIGCDLDHTYKPMYEIESLYMYRLINFDSLDNLTQIFVNLILIHQS